MATYLTFDDIREIVAEHRRAEAARNAPAAVALEALNTIRAVWADLTPAERGDIRAEVDELSSEMDEAAWANLGAMLAQREG